MGATTVLLRSIVGEELRFRRAVAIAERNATVLRSVGSYGTLVLSGFVEPLLYLVALGWGLGELVGTVPLADGRTVSYLVFLAPALLAASAMSGALAETTINFFTKLKYFRHYTPVLNTPLNPSEIALGELTWSMLRGAMYIGLFLLGMVALGLTTPALAVLALPAALLVGIAFGGLGLALTTFLRGWADFEYVGGVQFALFVFSGTFVPITAYPAALQLVVQLTPLYHGVELVRGLVLGWFDWVLLGHAAYLLALALVAFLVAARRMQRRFCV